MDWAPHLDDWLGSNPELDRRTQVLVVVAEGACAELRRSEGSCRGSAAVARRRTGRRRTHRERAGVGAGERRRNRVGMGLPGQFHDGFAAGRADGLRIGDRRSTAHRDAVRVPDLGERNDQRAIRARLSRAFAARRSAERGAVAIRRARRQPNALAFRRRRDAIRSPCLVCRQFWTTGSSSRTETSQPAGSP